MKKLRRSFVILMIAMLMMASYLSVFAEVGEQPASGGDTPEVTEATEGQEGEADADKEEPAQKEDTEDTAGKEEKKDSKDTKEKEDKEEKASLAEQELTAKIYTDDTYKKLYNKDKKDDEKDLTVITVKGMLPKGTEVRAYPVKAELDEAEEALVIASYDITLFGPDGKSFQPEEGPVTVEFSGPVIDEALESDPATGSGDSQDEDDDTASVLHVCGDGTEETLTASLEDTDEGYVYTFETKSFSTFTLYRTGTSSNESFTTTIRTGRFGGSQTDLSGTAKISNDGQTGWLNFDEIVAKWNPAYSYSGSNGRYSVIRANDSGGNRHQALCSVGFMTRDGTLVDLHYTLGRYATDDTVNGSAANYDLRIELNDNSLPVQIVVDGGTATNTVFVPADSAASYTAAIIAESLGYSGYTVASSTINGNSVNSVSRVQLTVSDVPTNTSSTWWSRLLAGETFSFPSGSVLVTGARVSYPATNVSYPAAYKWTYNNGTTVGDTPYVINLETPIAKVSNDGGNTWTYHSYLIDNGTQADGVTKKGAFDQANTLTGDVIVELLYDTHERYTLNSGFNFNNTGIDSLTIKGTGNKSTIVKDQTASPMITTTGIDTVEVNNMIFDGKDKITNNANGGGLKTDAADLTVSNCEFKNCQAGYQGGGVYHNNDTATATITGTTFSSCRANGPDDATGGGGGGLFTNALSLTVTNSTFDTCTTKVRQGAGIFHKRVNGPPVSDMTIKECTFNKCESKWSGGGVETDAWNVTVEDSTFTDCKATKGAGLNVWANGHDKSPESTTLSVKGCTFTNCAGTDNGGAVRSTALSSVIEDSEFEKCSSTKNGGAIACTNDCDSSSVTITDCEITECTATAKGGACFTNAKNLTVSETSSGKTVMDGCTAEDGGAIYSNPLTMTGGTISNCEATGNGGAINSTLITMSNSTVTGNKTGGDTAAVRARATTQRPGYLFSGDLVIAGNIGSGGEARDVYLDVESDRFIQIASPGLGNNASVGVYVADTNPFNGYGIPNMRFATTGSVNVSNITNVNKLFSDRLDNGPMYGAPATPESGTGDSNYPYRIMWQSYLCKLTDSEGKLLYKDAEHNDPAVYTTLKSAFADCKVTLYKYDGTPYTYDPANDINVEMLKNYVQPAADQVTIDAKRTITLTTANTDASDNPGPDDPYIYVGGSDTGMDPERATITRGWTNDTDNNTAAMFYMNETTLTLITKDIIIDGNGGTYKGRGIRIDNGTLSVEDGTTMRHFRTTTTDGGAAIYQRSSSTGSVKINNRAKDSEILFEDCDNGNEEGGAIRSQSTVTVNNAGTLTFKDCIAGTGGAIETEHNSNAHIIIENTGNILFDNCKGTKSNWAGGALCTYTSASSISITGSGKTVFNNCSSANSGGGLFSSGTVTVENVEFNECSAPSGGGIYAKGNASVTNTTFTDCSATANGGGIYANGVATVTDTTFTDCSATANGGGIYARGNTTVTDTTFSGCSATTDYGGGIYQYGGSAMSLENVSFGGYDSNGEVDPSKGCTAGKVGGAVCYEPNSGKVTADNCSFIGCTAGTFGGAFENDSTADDSFAFTDCVFDTCSSGSSGGGGAYMKGNGTMTDCSFTDCSTSGNGGALYLAKGAMLDGVDIDGRKTPADSTANAKLGSAIFFNSGNSGTVTIKDGEIKDCSASDAKGGAINVNNNNCVVAFEGGAKVHQNYNTTTDTGHEHNVVLDRDYNTVIQTTKAGISDQADIGVYVTGNMPPATETNPYKNHGGSGDDFGTYASGGSTDNFDRFLNDRNGLRGEECTVSSHMTNRLIRWGGLVPAPTAVHYDIMPYLIMLAAALLISLILVLRKRRMMLSDSE